MLKYFLTLYLLLHFIQIFSQGSLIAKQGFEDSGDSWPIESFSTPPCTKEGDIWNYQSLLGDIQPIEGEYFWGIQDLNGNCGSSGFEFIELTSYDISNYRNVSVSFDVIVKGYDNGDDMKYEIWFDGESQGEILFIEGQDNLSLEQWKTVSIKVPNRISSVKLKISVKQNGSDIAGIDHLRLEGEQVKPCSELMISEYLEGGSSSTHRNNYIELYNPGDSDLDLSHYKLVKYTGTNSEPSVKLQLSGTLKPLRSFLIEDQTELLSISADLSTNSTVMDFNGDDKISLEKNDSIIDLIGKIGNSDVFGRDLTLRRKSQIKSPNNEFDSNEWETYGFEDTDNLNFHASYCQGNLPEIEVYGKSEPILDGSASTSLNNNTYIGAWPISKDTIVERSFIIKNSGNRVLNIDQILISGNDPGFFSTGFTSPATVAINDSLTFKVAYRPDKFGLHTAKIEIFNSDPSENPFEFIIQGEGTDSVRHPLIISQYYEGEANNKWIEITNTSHITSPENTYYLALFRNEATRQPIGIKPSSKKLIPSIPPGGSIKYSASLNVTIPAYAIDGNEIKTNVCSFTGDDIIVISTSGSESCWVQRTDIIGSSENWGTDLSMVRKYGCDAQLPNTGFETADWLVYPNDMIDMASPESNLRIGVHHSGPAIWLDGSWVNGKPDTNRKAIIQSNYLTRQHGNIEACSLHILDDINFSVQASGHIKIRDFLFVEGILEIDHEGSLVMISDDGFIRNSGSIFIHKTANDLKPYDYTYWSSPIKNAILESVFNSSPINSFYHFSAKDFKDINNDGRDDDGKAWVRTSGDMKIGRGYTAMAPDTTPFVNLQNVSFIGTPNNGLIEIPINIQSTTYAGQHHWNLIGNPYPSSIDADKLFNHTDNKNLLSGTLYFWTHSTPAVIDETNGSKTYSSNDYAMYTIGTGGIKAHPNGREPTQFISSCQGFFVEALKEGNLTLNNSMRTSNDTQNFFKIKEPKDTITENKIWLNLTGKNGLFSQILIGFVNGATDNFDQRFDGIRMDTQNPVSFYSLSKGQSLAIQGLPPFRGNEVIQLGFLKRSAEETPLEISIDHKNGNFKNKLIILHDKLLNKKHNLTVSPYSFNSALSGKIDDRFDLFYDTEYIDELTEVQADSKILWHLKDNILWIKTNKDEIIERLEIFDLNGRIIKDMIIRERKVEINWSGFPSRAIYLIRASLENSKTILTKMIP